MPLHPVLLGDSIFDNAAYIAGGTDVAQHLRGLLGEPHGVTLAAIDGSTCAMTLDQLGTLPDTATHLVVSAGGNDILHHVALLGQPATSVAEVLRALADARDPFAASHRELLEKVASLGLPVAVCTIYDANHPTPHDRLVATALAVFNDAITRNAHALGCDVIDLRVVCTDRSDYANPIEPSDTGGAKIAAALRRYLQKEAVVPGQTRVFF